MIHDMEAELQRVTQMVEAFAETVRKTAQELEQEKRDRVSAHSILQRQLSNCWNECASERGERKQLRPELAAKRPDNPAQFMLRHGLEDGAGGSMSTEACTNQGGSTHSDRGGPGNDIDDILSERISIGDTASQCQERSDADFTRTGSESGFLDVLSKKVRDEVAHVFADYQHRRKEPKEHTPTSPDGGGSRESHIVHQRLHRLEQIIIGQDTDIVFLPQQGLLGKIDWMREQVESIAQLREEVRLVQQDCTPASEFQKFVKDSIDFREDFDEQLRSLWSVCGTESVSRDEFERNTQRFWDAIVTLQTKQLKQDMLPPTGDVASEGSSGPAKAEAAKNPPTPRARIPAASPPAPMCSTPGIPGTPVTPGSPTRVLPQRLASTGLAVSAKPLLHAAAGSGVARQAADKGVVRQQSVPTAVQAAWAQHAELSPRPSNPRELAPTSRVSLTKSAVPHVKKLVASHIDDSGTIASA